ncbi:hypothetical protein PR048_028983 [Dryococelus australis]|uniref:Uncharacterized protein n=1 Tax=Dryococelus australis TaxID=614101 RepID=A0ABQ9GCP2_9NEOP|nr:hypothetical protein PR048_028983 [Dryococelus australis]
MMGHHVMTVCVFCVLCTSHTQCSLHSTSSVHKQNRFVVNSKDFRALKPPATGMLVQVTGRTRREVNLPAHVVNSGESYFIKKVFEKFGDGETMTLEGFEKLLSSLGLKQFMVENVVVSRTEKVDVAAVVNSAGGGGDKSNGM